jgi:hydrogenase-4 component B
MSPALGLVLGALVLFAASGPAALPGSSHPERRPRAQQRAAFLMVLAGVLGLAGVVWHLVAGTSAGVDLAWGLPGSRFVLKLDSLAAVFLVPVFLVPALAAVYGLGYRPAAALAAGSRRLDVAQGLLAATMGLVVLAGDGLLVPDRLGSHGPVRLAGRHRG